MISIFVGLAAVVLASLMLNRQQPVSVTKVVAASKALDAYSELSADNMKLIDWPQGNVPVGAKTSLEGLVSRQISVGLSSGELIMDSLLVPAGTVGGLAIAISPGKRAVSVSLNEAGDVAGFLLPGNYVDILLNTKDPSGQSFSKIIVQHVLVLAIAQDRVVKDPTKAKVVNSVTLEVTPQEAEGIDMARSVGILSLALRNQTDSLSTGSAGASQSALHPRGSAIEIIRGKERTLERALNY